MQDELLRIDRLVQLMLQLQPLGHIAAHLQLEVQIALATLLGLPERRFGLLHERRGILPIPGVAREPGAARDAKTATVNLEGLVEHCGVDHRRDAVDYARQLPHHQRKGTATQVADGPLALGGEPHPLGYLLHEGVPEAAAESVVDPA